MGGGPGAAAPPPAPTCSWCRSPRTGATTGRRATSRVAGGPARPHAARALLPVDARCSTPWPTAPPAARCSTSPSTPAPSSPTARRARSPSTSTSHRVVVRAVTVGDLRSLPAGAGPEALRSALLERCVVRATCDGSVVPPGELPAAVVDRVESALDDLDPTGDVVLVLTCEDCGERWAETLDPVRFAWAALESSARRLATDVHALARAYGWSEQDILGPERLPAAPLPVGGRAVSGYLMRLAVRSTRADGRSAPPHAVALRGGDAGRGRRTTRPPSDDRTPTAPAPPPRPRCPRHRQRPADPSADRRPGAGPTGAAAPAVGPGTPAVGVAGGGRRTPRPRRPGCVTGDGRPRGRPGRRGRPRRGGSRRRTCRPWPSPRPRRACRRPHLAADRPAPPEARPRLACGPRAAGRHRRRASGRPRRPGHRRGAPSPACTRARRRQAPAPEVTVSIGRIEVVAAPPAAAGHRSGAGARRPARRARRGQRRRAPRRWPTTCASGAGR